MLNRLTIISSQPQPTPALDLLTAPKTLEEQYKTFLITVKGDGRSYRTVTYYRYQLGRFIRYCLSENINDAKQITSQHIRTFLLSLHESNKPQSRLTYHKAIKRFFNWLVEWEILKTSPMNGIKPPPQPHLVIKPFTREQCTLLLSLPAGSDFLTTRNRAILLTFLDTGIRVSEMAGIMIEDVNFDVETIRIMGKGSKERYVRVGRKTQKAIAQYCLKRAGRDNYPNLWVTEEFQPITLDGVQSMVKKLCLRAGITGAKCGPHTFRHTFAINYLRNGGDVFTLQIILGHSTLAMTRRYVSALNYEDAFKAHEKASPVDNMRL